MKRPTYLRGGIVSICFLLLMALISRKMDADAEISVTGTHRAADGDSLRTGKERLRLLGIDAPELAQTCLIEGRPWPCGKEAKNLLAALIGPGTVCKGTKRDRFDRLLAVCTRRGMDINREMVRRGMAVSFGDYAADEDAARAARRGLWASDFQRPAAWRKTHQAGFEEEPGQGLSFISRIFGGH